MSVDPNDIPEMFRGDDDIPHDDLPLAPCPGCGRPASSHGGYVVAEIDGVERDYPVGECSHCYPMGELLGEPIPFSWVTDSQGRPRDFHDYSLIDLQPRLN